jgi:hypothetical protein
MSDHEDGGPDDWEEGTLPATPAIGTSYAHSESLLKPSHHVSYTQRRPLQDRANPRTFLGQRRSDNIGEDRHSRRPEPTNGIPGRVTGVEARQARAAETKRDGPPTRSYTMSVTWSTLLTNINSNGTTPAKLARERLDEIAVLTEAYVETPNLNSTEIWIWGSTDQAVVACDLLRKWELEVRETGRRPHRDHWVKQHALDGRVEERKERQATHKIVKSQWKAFEESLDHSVELCLLWPQNIGLEDFQQEHTQTIQDLEEAYDCRILCNKLHSMVQVFAHDQGKVLEVHNRLINIGREMIAKRNEVIRANFLRHPNSSTFRNGVQLKKDERTENFLPSLCGAPLGQNEIERYEAFTKRVNHITRVKTRRHIEKGLTGHLQLSSKHVRMRVTFLDLAFLQYKRPGDDKPHHDFPEYVDMIGDERTTIKAQGLRSNGKDFSQLAEKLTEHLGQPSTAYAVHFDFHMGAMQKGSTLRFECEWKQSFMEDEVEKSAQRWIEHRSEAEDDLLLINVLDFERPGYQIAIRAVPFPDNRAIRDEMDLFARGVDFTPPPEGIKALPKRRAKFPPGRQMLKQVSEMTVLRYNYNEHGVFELRRRDSYLVNSESKEITTNWSACYYYHDWDNMMGKFGDLKPGQDVDFNRSVATFFPVQNHEKVEAGLKRFTNEIEELQTLLGACINVLPVAEIKEPLQLATPPPEVKESPPIINKGKGKADEEQNRTEVGTPKVNGQKGKGKAGEEGWTEVGTPKMSDQKGKGKMVDSTPNTAKKRQDVRKTYGVRPE